jgi:ABC-type polysaccharide/polyol phosphate export permease
MLAMAIGLGMLFAPINTMMQDMSRLVEFIFTFGLFMVPTIYKTPDITEASGWQAVIYWVHTLNPISYFMNAVRDLMQTGSFVIGPGFIASSILGFLILAIGWRTFHICEPLLAERL